MARLAKSAEAKAKGALVDRLMKAHDAAMSQGNPAAAISALTRVADITVPKLQADDDPPEETVVVLRQFWDQASMAGEIAELMRAVEAANGRLLEQDDAVARAKELIGRYMSHIPAEPTVSIRPPAAAEPSKEDVELAELVLARLSDAGIAL